MSTDLFRPLTFDYPSPYPFLICAGPCSAETEEQTYETARLLRARGIRLFRASLWKPRTRPGSFEGVGAEGLAWLRRIEQELGIQAMTEVASVAHVEACLQAGIHTLWVGARTTASPFAVSELAEALSGTDVTLLVKNPLNPDLDLWEGALLRFHAAGITRIGAVHRGFSTYGKGQYRNAPLWQIPIELRRRHPELTILSDPSHIAGRRELVPMVCQASLEMNFSGLMVETHPTPSEAWSDAAQQLTPDSLISLLDTLLIHPTRNTADSEALSQLRQSIDHIDRQLLHLLSERMKLARSIGEIKAKDHLPIVQPERYRTLLQERLRSGRKLGLEESFLHELFSSIHEASVHVQHISPEDDR